MQPNCPFRYTPVHPHRRPVNKMHPRGQLRSRRFATIAAAERLGPSEYLDTAGKVHNAG